MTATRRSERKRGSAFTYRYLYISIIAGMMMMAWFNVYSVHTSYRLVSNVNIDTQYFNETEEGAGTEIESRSQNQHDESAPESNIAGSSETLTVEESDEEKIKYGGTNYSNGDDGEEQSQGQGQGQDSKDRFHSIQEHRKTRIANFNSWFEGNSTDKLLPNSDANGTILDFAIIGYPKCGTTTVAANLAKLAPMPTGQDICTPIHQTVYYAHKNWPREYGARDGDEEKLLRGTKCPAFIQDEWLKEWSTYLPRTKLILGMRHPVLWFQSFWNMQAGNRLTKAAGNDPYKLTKPCDKQNGRGCRFDCPNNQIFCVHRGSFHVSMARLGKTALTTEERNLLSERSYPLRAGMNLVNHVIQNPIFVYEQRELKEDYVWAEMADYLDVPQGRITHDEYHGSHGKNKGLGIDFCNEKYDAFRAIMMPEAYDLSTWLQEYFIPLAMNKSRTDVRIPRPDRFMELVEDYKKDPCGRLVRLSNGTYSLGDNILSG